MPHDCQCWGWFHVWYTEFRRCPLRSSHLANLEVEVHQQASFSKDYVLVVDQLLYFRFECVAIFSWVPYRSSMISTLHIGTVPRREWLLIRLQRFWIHQRALNQRLQKLTVRHGNQIKMNVPSFQVVLKPMLALMLILISSALGLLIWMMSDPWLSVWGFRHCWFLIRIAWRWKWWPLKRWRIIRSCWCTMRILDIFHDYISFILLLLGIPKGFILSILTARGILDFSALETALDALSHHHQVREAWGHISYHHSKVWAMQGIHEHVKEWWLCSCMG